VKKTVGHKKASKKIAFKKKKASKAATKVAKAKKLPKREPGFSRQRGSRLLVPDSLADGQPIKPSLLEKGLRQASQELQRILESMDATLDGFAIQGVKLSASFDAKGQFLGFGASGAMAIEITVGPAEE
jgi:hypothetical protein